MLTSLPVQGKSLSLALGYFPFTVTALLEIDVLPLFKSPIEFSTSATFVEKAGALAVRQVQSREVVSFFYISYQTDVSRTSFPNHRTFIPGECSWTWRKIRKLRYLARDKIKWRGSLQFLRPNF